jgi:hypothetical protein
MTALERVCRVAFAASGVQLVRSRASSWPVSGRFDVELGKVFGDGPPGAVDAVGEHPQPNASL